MSVEVQYALEGDDAPRDCLPGEALITQWVRTVLAHQQARGEITVRIVGAAEGLELNRAYRGGRSATNVLSFAYEEMADGTRLLGDIVICAPVVMREADAQGKPPEAHWAHMVVHGVLHLLGYDHERDHEARVMEDLERILMHALGYTDPYAEDQSNGDRLDLQMNEGPIIKHHD